MKTRLNSLAPSPIGWLAIILFVAGASLLWQPFDSYSVLYGTKPGGSVPAGEIRSGFELTQQVQPPTVGNSTADSGARHCFAIRFATYARRNSGHLQVRWRQGALSQNWRVAASDLADNTYRHFCPDTAFSAYRPFHLEVAGVDGEPGKSATLWLVSDSRFGTANLPADLPQGKSIALQGSTRNHTTAGEMLRIDQGAYLIGWLCTLAIGILALASTFGRRRHSDNA